MSLVSGHTGNFLLGGGGTSVNAFIKSWTLEDTAQMHDITTMGSAIAARTFLKGLESARITAEFVADSAMALDVNSPGDAISAMTLDATGPAGSNDAWEYIIAVGVIESINFTRDVDGLARGTIVVQSSGRLAANIQRPDGVAV